MAKPIAITEQNFKQEVIQSDKPVLLDFWASWCAPCMMVGPVVEEIAGDYEGKLKVGKVDVDSNQQLAANFGIRSIPTLMIIKGGNMVDSIIGAVPKQTIAEMVDKYIS